MPDTFDSALPEAGAIHHVAWTRGRGCSDIADRLAGGTATKIDGDLGRSCVRERIDTLVSRKLTSFDLVPVVVPHDVDVEGIESVTAAVGAGPHSPFAVSVAARLGVTMGIPVTAVSVHEPGADPTDARARLGAVTERFPAVDGRVVPGDSAVALLDDAGPSTLLVVGAPGGSWFQRQLFGPGHRLQVAAPAGTLTVRWAARRCFHFVGDDHGAVVGSEMSVSDARHVIRYPVVSVADHGALVGVVRRADLAGASPDALLRDVMEAPVSVGATDEVTVVEQVRDAFDGGPIPVVDRSERLLGVIAPHRSGWPVP